MYCQNCGKADQKENTYCRQCGNFLPDLKAISALDLGGSTPQQNARTISFISLFAAVFSLFVGVWMYLTQFNVPVVLYLAAAVLICNAFWHLSNFYVVRKMTNRLKPEQKDSNIENQLILEGKSEAYQKVLTGGDISEFAIPESIVEETTKNLTEKINRKSS